MSSGGGARRTTSHDADVSQTGTCSADTALAAAGTLDRSFGGVATLLTSEQNLRRTLYGIVDRHELEPMLRIHDFPDPAAHSASRRDRPREFHASP